MPDIKYKKIQRSFRFYVGLDNWLQKKAEEKQTTISQIVISLLEKEMDKEKITKKDT